MGGPAKALANSSDTCIWKNYEVNGTLGIRLVKVKG